jgi:hypothetical protein
MSQKKRLEILRCVVLLNFFSKKRSFSVLKTWPPLTSESKTARYDLRCEAVGFVMILLSIGNHFESESARYALLCRSGRLLFCYNSAKLKRKHFWSKQRRRPIAALLPPIPRRFSRPCRPLAAFVPVLMPRTSFAANSPPFCTAVPPFCRTCAGFCPQLARQRMAASLLPSVLNAVLLDALNINSY